MESRQQADQLATLSTRADMLQQDIEDTQRLMAALQGDTSILPLWLRPSQCSLCMWIVQELLPSSLTCWSNLCSRLGAQHLPAIPQKSKASWPHVLVFKVRGHTASPAQLQCWLLQVETARCYRLLIIDFVLAAVLRCCSQGGRHQAAATGGRLD